MKVNSIFLDGFRNYDKQQFAFRENVNVIYGDNAQGKTNLIEAIYLLSSTKSFRTALKREIIGFGRECCSAEAEILSRNRKFILKTEISQNSPILFKVNGIKCKRNYEMSGMLNSVLFSPDHLDIIKGSAAVRRRFMDSALCQLRPAYADAVSNYSKLLESKNKILRDGAQKPSLYELLDDFSERMVSFGSLIIKRRAEFFNFIDKEAGIMHSGISGGREELKIEYKTVSGVEDISDIKAIEASLRKRMSFHREHEISAMTSLCGPHRDDFDVFINGVNARDYGSQGQVRTAAVSLKLSERQLFLKDTGEYPVLLLDDVLSELDRPRQNFILNSIADGQVFVTCCSREQTEGISADGIFNIKDGRLI